MNWYAMSDKALIEVIGSFIRDHRLKQNKSQGQVAKQAGISRSTLSLLEKGETVTLSTLIQVLRVLEQLHVLDNFQVPNQVSPLELAKTEQRKRKRARSKKHHIDKKEESEW